MLKTWMALALAAVPLAAGAADLPKSGKFSGHYGWVFQGQVQELGPNRTVYVGMLPGVFFNDAGSGFMHKTRVDCTIVNDVDNGKANGSGTCSVVDADGDKAFLTWRCAGAMPACPGEYTWTGGTGKFQGIHGSDRFQGNFIGGSGGGWSDWTGEYHLK